MGNAMDSMKSVTTGRSIPKPFAGIAGLRTGFNPSSCSQSRIVVTGMPGAGKSTFLNSFPGLLMLDPERGGDTVADPQALRYTPPPETALVDLPAAYLNMVERALALSVKDKSITMIGIDTIDEYIDIHLDAFCAQHGIQDPMEGNVNGYAVVRKQIFGMLDTVHRAGLGWAIIAHTVTKTVKSGGIDKEVTRLAVSDSFRAAIFKKCEHMLFIEHGTEQTVTPVKAKVVKGRTIPQKDKVESKRVRVLKTRPGGLFLGGDAQDVKVRVPLPDRIVLPEKGGHQVFEKAFDEAVVILTSEEN